MQLVNGLSEVQDTEHVNNFVESIKKQFEEFKDTSFDGEYFKASLEIDEFLTNFILSKHVNNQKPLIFSTGFWY